MWCSAILRVADARRSREGIGHANLLESSVHGAQPVSNTGPPRKGRQFDSVILLHGVQRAMVPNRFEPDATVLDIVTEFDSPVLLQFCSSPWTAGVSGSITPF